MDLERGVPDLGRAGCQPAVLGSLPSTRFAGSGIARNKSESAIADVRPASCRPGQVGSLRSP